MKEVGPTTKNIGSLLKNDEQILADPYPSFGEQNSRNIFSTAPRLQPPSQLIRQNQSAQGQSNRIQPSEDFEMKDEEV